MKSRIDSLLVQLPEPAPPAALLASVMARIEREQNRPTTPARERSREMSARDRPAWVWAVIGIAVVVGLTIYRQVTAAEPADVISSRIGPGGMAQMPLKATDLLLLATGLWLFLIGLFAPLRRHER